jgi:hypothetical protein
LSLVERGSPFVRPVEADSRLIEAGARRPPHRSRSVSRHKAAGEKPGKHEFGGDTLMKTALIAGASALLATLAATSPVIAAEGVKMNYDAKSDKYCYKDSFTGSRMPKTVCRSRAELEADGIKVPVSKKTEVAVNAATSG